MTERDEILRDLEAERRLLAEMKEDRRDLEYHIGEMEVELDGIQDEIDAVEREIKALEADLAELPDDETAEDFYQELADYDGDA